MLLLVGPVCGLFSYCLLDVLRWRCALWLVVVQRVCFCL